MKKGLKNFLTFLMCIVTISCISSVFYQFAKNDEVISVTANTVYINYGETLSLEDIGFSRKKIDKNTKINFNAGGEQVCSIIKFDEVNKRYVVSDKGGETTIKITTTNKKYKSFEIKVFVGLGTKQNPYYISNEKQLFNIGQLFDLDANYLQVNDITITKPHSPIGADVVQEGIYSYREFNGNFNGNFKTITDFKTTSQDYAGLFAIIGRSGEVSNLTVKNFNIDGFFKSVGAIAGQSYGYISKVEVIDSSITNSNTDINSTTGAIVGTLKTDNSNNQNSIATIISSMATTNTDKFITANGIVGGIAGIAENAKIHACYTHLNLQNEGAGLGGLVGNFIVGNNSYLYESYAITNLTQNNAGKAGNIIGEITLQGGVDLKTINTKLVLLGNYFNNQANTFGGVGVDTYKFSNATSFTIMGRNRNALKSTSTYVYFLEDQNKVVYWDGLWTLSQGQFPALQKANVTPITPKITNANPTQNALIGTKEELLQKFSSASVSGNFIITNHIDLGGATINPVYFKGSFKADNNKSYTISNFKINSNDKSVGFFSVLDNAVVSNITFSNVEILASSNKLNSAGIVAGYVKGNTIIDNVHINFATISTTSTYAGGVVGYTDPSSNIKISNTYVAFLNIKGNNDNVGGIAGYVGTNTSLTDNVVSSKVGIGGIKRVGGIASTNYGTIENNGFYGHIYSIGNINEQTFFGGIVAVNYSKIYNCSTNPNIEILNTSVSKSSIGGIAGYNSSIIENCTVTNENDNYTISGEKSSRTIYIGGLVGFNYKGAIRNSSCNLTSIGSLRNSTFTAGLACINEKGTIYGCTVKSNLLGDFVAGLAIFNYGGTIDSCFAGISYNTRCNYQGSIVSGLVYSITEGKIIDCLVNANLQGTDNEGWVVGFASFMPYENNSFGIIETCIANVSINGVGKKFLDCQQGGLFSSSRKTGSIINCIINSEAKVKGVIVSSKDKTIASGSNYVVCTNEELANINTYLQANKTDFDINSNNTDNSAWYFDIANNYAMPRVLVK